MKKNIFSNIWNLQVGDTITFTNKYGIKIAILVTRVEEKSWYALGRNSWGTLANYAKYPDFQIVKKEVESKNSNLNGAELGWVEF